MPNWLQRQLRRAFLNKDLRQINILNDCWYIYIQTYGHPLKNTRQPKQGRPTSY